MIHIKSEKEIELMRESGTLAASILQKAVEFTAAGVTTNQINELVHDLTVKNGAYPSPLNYRGFPKSVCTSVNEVVTHGIPGDYVLQEGDIINIDVTCNLNGYHGDTSRMVVIGTVPEDVMELVQVTRECLEQGIAAVRPAGHFGDIGNIIQDIADEHGFAVVTEYCGHGIGRNFHEDPLVLHHRTGKPGPKITKGMVFTIEPMINMEKPSTEVLDDGWTVVTKDRKPSAQFEHTLAVTADGIEILTPYPGEASLYR